MATQINTHEENRRRITPFFLLSLLLHSSMLLLFIIYAFRDNRIIVLKKVQSLKEMPASLKPRKGTLENNVFFDFSEPEKNFPVKEIVKKAVQSSATLPTQQTPTKEAASTTPQPVKKQATQQEATQNTTGELGEEDQEGEVGAVEEKYGTNKLATHKEKPTEPAKESSKAQKPETTIEEEKLDDGSEALKKLTPEELKQLALQNLFKNMPKPTNQKNVKVRQQPTLSEMLAAKLNRPARTVSANMPMGVPGISQSQGSDLAERLGDDGKTPTFEDMKYVCYLRKLARCLEDQLNRAVAAFNSGGKGSVSILFEIGRHGTLDGIEVMGSTNTYLQGLLLNAIKTSAPFPPLPKYFEKDFFFSKVEFKYEQTATQRHMEGVIYALV